MPYGRINNAGSPGSPESVPPTGAGFNYGRVNRNPTPRVFNSLPGEVLRVLGTYDGKAQCVGGSRQVVTDLPTGLFNYQQKLAIINSETPEPNTVAIMPAGTTGHVGVVLREDGDDVLMYDVNADGQNTQMIRRVPKDKIDGYFKGDPEKVDQTKLAQVSTYFDSEITKDEQRKIESAEKEVVKFNTDRVFDELKGERPNESEELGGIQKLIKETVEKPGFWETYTQGLKTFADPTIGALKGVVSTVENASELGQRGLRATSAFIADKLGFDEAAEMLRSQDIAQVAPLIEKATGMTEGTLTTPTNGWQTAGFFLEKVGEFMLPGGAVKNTQKGLTSLPAIASLPPKLKGLVQLGIVSATEAATFGGVSAIQEGRVFQDDGTLDPNVKTSAIIGGAFPIAAAGLKSLKNFISPQIKTLLTKAIRPPKNASKEFANNIDEVMAAVHKKFPNIKTLEELNNALKNTADDVWKQVDEILKQTNKSAAVNGNTIADKIIKEMSKESKLIRENPNFLKDVRAFVKQYRGLLPVNEADDILRATNRDLSTFYKKMLNSGIGNANAANYSQKLQAALAKALREGIDDAVQVADAPSVKGLRELYGKIASIARVVDDRAVVFNRQNLLNLQQGINLPAGGAKVVSGLASGNLGQAAEGVSQLASSQILKTINSADTQIANAFQKMGSVLGTLSPSSRGILGGIATGLNLGSEEKRQDREEFKGRDLIDSIKVPDFSSLPGAGAIGDIAQSDLFRGGANLFNAFIPSANAAGSERRLPSLPGQSQPVDTTRKLPSIPTPQPVRPTAASVGKVASIVAPETTKQVGAVQDFLKNVGRLTPEQLRSAAPKPDKPGVGSFFDPQFSSVAKNLQQHNQQIQDAQDLISGKKPSSQKTIAEIYNESDTKKAVESAKEMFRKSFF